MDNAKVVLVFISKGYMNRVNANRIDYCKLVFSYAMQSKFESGRVIPVVTDVKMRDSSISTDPNAPLSTKGINMYDLFTFSFI